jgi:ribosomal protein S4E
VSVRDLDNILCLGFITGHGHDDEHAKVKIPITGEIVVPRHHIRVQNPAGRQNKIVVVEGEHLGKVGIVESVAVRYAPNWLVIEHKTKSKILVKQKDMLRVDHF